jgi:hypothetical protein
MPDFHATGWLFAIDAGFRQLLFSVDSPLRRQLIAGHDAPPLRVSPDSRHAS